MIPLILTFITLELWWFSCLLDWRLFFCYEPYFSCKHFKLNKNLWILSHDCTCSSELCLPCSRDRWPFSRPAALWHRICMFSSCPGTKNESHSLALTPLLYLSPIWALILPVALQNSSCAPGDLAYISRPDATLIVLTGHCCSTFLT